jgi:hypothetical protein
MRISTESVHAGYVFRNSYYSVPVVTPFPTNFVVNVAVGGRGIRRLRGLSNLQRKPSFL